MNGNIYPNPPLIEAICEFHFDPSSGWDATTPGLIYKELEKDFPQKEQVMQVNVSFRDDLLSPSTNMIAISRFTRQDNEVVIQVGPNLLTVNHLKPYSSWDYFRTLIEQGLNIYKQIVHPSALQGIAVRYINKVEFDTPTVEIEDFFEFYPYMGPRLPQPYGAFLMNVQIPYENNRDFLTMKMNPAPDSTIDKLIVLFEIGYYLNILGSIDIDNIDSWIEEAHSRIEEVFEASITDKLRFKFQ